MYECEGLLSWCHLGLLQPIGDVLLTILHHLVFFIMRSCGHLWKLVTRKSYDMHGHNAFKVHYSPNHSKDPPTSASGTCIPNSTEGTDGTSPDISPDMHPLLHGDQHPHLEPPRRRSGLLPSGETMHIYVDWPSCVLSVCLP